MIVFYNTIVFVKDIEASKKFYQDVIGLKLEEEYDTIKFFENHFVIHNGNALLNTIFGNRVRFNRKKGKQNLEIYFETDNLEEAYEKVVKSGVRIIHKIVKQAWGQNVFRFYDLDNHILEIGEAMHLEYLKK